MTDQVLSHLLWMCANMPNREDNPYKWNRWLGFIQGCCVSYGLANIETMKNANKISLDSGLQYCKYMFENEATVRNSIGKPRRINPVQFWDKEIEL